jgi:hypothetical protein
MSCSIVSMQMQRCGIHDRIMRFVALTQQVAAEQSRRKSTRARSSTTAAAGDVQSEYDLTNGFEQLQGTLDKLTTVFSDSAQLLEVSR